MGKKIFASYSGTLLVADELRHCTATLEVILWSLPCATAIVSFSSRSGEQYSRLSGTDWLLRRFPGLLDSDANRDISSTLDPMLRWPPLSNNWHF